MRTDIGYLMVENDDLRAENAQLRKRLHENARTTKRIEQAYKDAMLLSHWKTTFVHPGRDYAARVGGMSQRRWQNAIGLLKLARVVVRRRHWTTDEVAVVEVRLSKAKAVALADPQRFFLRLNRHATR